MLRMMAAAVYLCLFLNSFNETTVALLFTLSVKITKHLLRGAGFSLQCFDFSVLALGLLLCKK